MRLIDDYGQCNFFGSRVHRGTQGQDCYSRAASGHTATPPRRVMNSRRFTARCLPCLPTERIAHLITSQMGSKSDLKAAFVAGPLWP